MFIHQSLWVPTGLLTTTLQCVGNHLLNVYILLIKTKWGCCKAVWRSAVYLLSFLPPKADPKRRRLSLIKNDGWKGHSGKSEYATQKEAQKIRVIQQSQGESGGMGCFRAAFLICIHLVQFQVILLLLLAFTSSNGYGWWQFLESPEELHLWPLLWSFPE